MPLFFRCTFEKDITHIYLFIHVDLGSIIHLNIPPKCMVLQF